MGAAAITNNLKIQLTLTKYASVFTAELTAIELALHIVSNTNPGRHHIFTDSRSAMAALDKFTSTNRLVCQLQLELHNLINLGHAIQFCWIPSHVGIAGNETADQTAKAACSGRIQNPSVPLANFFQRVSPQNMAR